MRQVARLLMTSVYFLAGVIGLGLGAASAAGFGGTYTFDVFRNGELVGAHVFTFRHHAGQTKIEEASDFEVTLAFIPVYSFSHYHREVWQDGKLLEVDSVTDKNGKEIRLTLEADGNRLKRTINGKSDWIGPDVTLLALWNQDILDGTRFISVTHDKLLDASFRHMGAETFEIAGQPVTLEHYKMGGDQPREVWYDPAGHVARVRMDRDGSVMEFIRNEPTIELPRRLACNDQPVNVC